MRNASYRSAFRRHRGTVSDGGNLVDEYMIAWFVSGLNETLPVRSWRCCKARCARINAVGTMVFAVSIALVVVAQLLIGRRLRYARQRGH